MRRRVHAGSPFLVWGGLPHLLYSLSNANNASRRAFSGICRTTSPAGLRRSSLAWPTRMAVERAGYRLGLCRAYFQLSRRIMVGAGLSLSGSRTPCPAMALARRCDAKPGGSGDLCPVGFRRTVARAIALHSWRRNSEQRTGGFSAGDNQTVMVAEPAVPPVSWSGRCHCAAGNGSMMARSLNSGWPRLPAR